MSQSSTEHSRRDMLASIGGIGLTSIATYFAADPSFDMETPKAVFNSYIAAVRDGDMERIRELRSSAVDTENMEGWSQEYQEHDIAVSETSTIQKQDGRVILGYILTADAANRNMIKGEATLIKQGGKWRVENVQ